MCLCGFIYANLFMCVCVCEYVEVEAIKNNVIYDFLNCQTLYQLVLNLNFIKREEND